MEKQLAASGEPRRVCQGLRRRLELPGDSGIVRSLLEKVHGNVYCMSRTSSGSAQAMSQHLALLASSSLPLALRCRSAPASACSRCRCRALPLRSSLLQLELG